MNPAKLASIVVIASFTAACPAGHTGVSTTVHRKVIASSRDQPVSMTCQPPDDDRASRSMIRTADISIKAENPAAAFHRVTTATRRRGGYVAQARQYPKSASLTLRVPTSRLEEALCLLAQLGEVTQLRIRSNDVEARLETATARVEQLTQLRGSGASQEAFAHWMLTQLDAARREKKRLDNQIRLATIQVTIAGTGSAL